MNPIDDGMEPMPKRKVVRKAPTKRLSPSSGMGDIAAPVANTAEISETIEEDYHRVENISIAGGALHAAHIHGSRIFSHHVETEPVQSPVAAAAESDEDQEEPIVDVWTPTPMANDEKEFLAPESKSFEIKEKSKRSGVATFFIWLLDILIILGIIILFLLYKYPAQTQNWIAKFTGHGASQPTTTTSSSPVTDGSSTTQQTFRTATSVTALAQTVDTSVQSQFSSLSVQSSADPSEVAAQNLSGDVLLYQTAAQSEAQQIATYLQQQFGLQPKMQQSDSLQEDVLLYLSSTVSNPNLSNDVAAVYNASGKSGAAKQYCDTLTSYKAASCTAANATANTTGLAVSYKTEAEHFTLARTNAFAGATFQTAPASQVQDIVVTVGK